MPCECSHALHDGRPCAGRNCSCTECTPFPLGFYRHFKGGLYQATGLGRDSETMRVHVEYVSAGEKWHRVLRTPVGADKDTGWLDLVEVGPNGKTVQRFVLLEELSCDQKDCQKKEAEAKKP